MQQPDDDALLLESDHEVSGRTAIVSDDGDSVWLYLTARNGSKFERDCWLFNKPSAAPEPATDEYGRLGLPPPAPAELIDAAGVHDCPSEAHFRIEWSADGESVLVKIDDVPVGIASAQSERGFSRHVRTECGWGKPWDDALMKRLF